ncbi:hypothetical protein GCM10010873_16730 [Cypionkella aquatica]|uniref:Uncharacterized protein n=1 Tax=Cypionkella aquatica TaxID=1756042 RepID=A0AA37TRZ9_9RHOB|nr:hypothetical protein GCM10010873_16730 [Cypionkella aquatica]
MLVCRFSKTREAVSQLGLIFGGSASNSRNRKQSVPTIMVFLTETFGAIASSIEMSLGFWLTDRQKGARKQ